MAKVVTFGELMLRIQPADYYRFVQVDSMTTTFGGGEANVSVSLANYGNESYFVTKLPTHEIGQAAVNSLRKYGVHTEYIVCVVLVRDTNIDIFTDFCHSFASFVFCPELSAVVKVTRSCDAHFASCLTSLDTSSYHVWSQSRCDSCDVEPFCVLEDFFPVEFFWLCELN